jgi:folylpolyglutamate synthase/dihydropteroate synthase
VERWCVTLSLIETVVTDISVDVGLYTSPHLIAVRERIRVNGVPISEELFAKFFFDVWDRLEENDQVGSLSGGDILVLLTHEHSGSF